MSLSVLLTLGRLPKALELARALHDAGARVFVADPFARSLCKPSRAVAGYFQTPAPRDGPEAYRAALRELVRREKIDLVVPVSEEAIHVAPLGPVVAGRARVYGPAIVGIDALHDKLGFIETAHEAGLAAPETARADEPAALEIARSGDYVVKRRRGCSGVGLSMRPRGAPLSPSDRSENHVVQRRLRGREVSSFAICRNGEVLGGVLYEGLVFAGTVATCFRRVDDAPAAEAWVKEFVARTNYDGFVAFDLIVDPNGEAKPIECNPRLTSGVHFFQPDDLAACVLGEKLPTGKLRLKRQKAFQEGHTTLSLAYASIGRPREFVRRVRAMAGARDVLWSLRDPAPFLMMTPMSWDVLRPVLFDGVTFGEAATRDLEPPHRLEIAREEAPAPAFAPHRRAAETVQAQ